MFKNLKLRTKITLLVVFAAFIPMFASGLNVAKNNIDMQDAATEESIKLATTDLDHIAEGVYRMCETQLNFGYEIGERGSWKIFRNSDASILSFFPIR